MKNNKTWIKNPVVDRLVFVLPWAIEPDDDQEQLLKPIRRKISSGIAAGRCERAYPNGGRYRENFRIKLDGGSKAVVQIGALQPERQNGGIRVMVNPSRFKAGDAAQLNRYMRQIIGPSYPELLKRPLLNGIDFAVDVVGARLDRMLVSYSNARHITVFGKRITTKGMIEGYNFGSVTSDYMAAVYSKDIERAHAAVLSLARSGLGTEGLKANAVKQLKRARNEPSVVRVEVRGKKMRGMPLSKLSALPNRFARFRFAELNGQGSGLSSLTKTAFHAMARQDSVKAALYAFKHTKHARKVHAYWRTHQADWWAPEMLWSKSCAVVQAIGLFPPVAFI